jgi:hypothetical protein
VARGRGKLALGLVLGLFLLVGAAGAQSSLTVFDYWWSGSAVQVDLLYAHTSAGLSVVDRDSKQIAWFGSCKHSFPGNPPRGTDLFCTAGNGFAIGSIDDSNLASPSQDCTATLSYSPNYPMTLGMTRDDQTTMTPRAYAPIDAHLGLVVKHTGGNPFVAACESPSFGSSRADYHYYLDFISGYHSGPLHYHWSGVPLADTGLATGSVTFDGVLDIAITGGVPNPTVGQYVVSAIKDLLTSWWTAVANGVGSTTAAPGFFSSSAGTVQVTATGGGSGGSHLRFTSASRAAATVFTVQQSLRGNASTPLRVQLTSAGQALLQNTSSVPVINLTIRFTPSHGTPATLQATITPTLLPAITSVQFSGTPTNPTIVVRGRGLAPLPPKSPSGTPVGHDGCPAAKGNYGSDYGLLFNLNDLTKGWSAGTAFTQLHNTSCIGIIPTKVTSGEVDFRLGSFYTTLYPKFSLDAGDQVQVVLNGAAQNLQVAYG